MSRRQSHLAIAAFLLFLLIASSVVLWAADVTPEEVVAKSLDAIGSATARKDLKSRAIQGRVTYRILVGGSGAINGKFVFASEGQKSDYLFKINANGFLGEQFIYDGSKASVAGTYPDKSRSEFGNFILVQDAPIRENLLGGVWSTGWPLLDLDGRKAKVHSEGIKKIDGRELIALRYQPRKNTDLEIFLYFDPQTYQHVMTTYRMTISATIGMHGETSSARTNEARYRLEEHFSDFQVVDGLTLPTHYDLRYTFEGLSGHTKSIEWDVKATDIMNNRSIDPSAFVPQ